MFPAQTDQTLDNGQCADRQVRNKRTLSGVDALTNYPRIASLPPPMTDSNARHHDVLVILMIVLVVVTTVVVGLAA